MFSGALKKKSKAQNLSFFRKFSFVLSLLITVFCYYSLISYKQDKTHALSGELEIGNHGASVSSDGSLIGFLFDYFGSFNYIWPLFIVFLGYLIFLKKTKLASIDLFKVGLRVLGFNFLVIGLCSTLSTTITLEETGGGGILGDFLNILFAALVGPSFAGAVGFFVALIGFFLFITISPLALIDLVGSFVTSIFDKNKDDTNENEATKAQDSETGRESDSKINIRVAKIFNTNKASIPRDISERKDFEDFEISNPPFTNKSQQDDSGTIIIGEGKESNAQNLQANDGSTITSAHDAINPAHNNNGIYSKEDNIATSNQGQYVDSQRGEDRDFYGSNGNSSDINNNNNDNSHFVGADSFNALDPENIGPSINTHINTNNFNDRDSLQVRADNAHANYDNEHAPYTNAQDAYANEQHKDNEIHTHINSRREPVFGLDDLGINADHDSTRPLNNGRVVQNSTNSSNVAKSMPETKSHDFDRQDDNIPSSYIRERKEAVPNNQNLEVNKLQESVHDEGPSTVILDRSKANNLNHMPNYSGGNIYSKEYLDSIKDSDNRSVDNNAESFYGTSQPRDESLNDVSESIPSSIITHRDVAVPLDSIDDPHRIEGDGHSAIEAMQDEVEKSTIIYDRTIALPSNNAMMPSSNVLNNNNINVNGTLVTPYMAQENPQGNTNSVDDSQAVHYNHKDIERLFSENKGQSENQATYNREYGQDNALNAQANANLNPNANVNGNDKAYTTGNTSNTTEGESNNPFMQLESDYQDENVLTFTDFNQDEVDERLNIKSELSSAFIPRGNEKLYSGPSMFDGAQKVNKEELAYKETEHESAPSLSPLISEKDRSYSYQNAQRGVNGKGSVNPHYGTISQNSDESDDGTYSGKIAEDAYVQVSHTDTQESKSDNIIDNTRLQLASSISYDKNNEDGQKYSAYSDDLNGYGKSLQKTYQEGREVITDPNASFLVQNSNSTNLPSYMQDERVNNDLNPSNNEDKITFEVPTKINTLSTITAPFKDYGPWRPSINLLTPSKPMAETDKADLDEMAHRIDAALKAFGIKARVARYVTGPVITRYDIELELGERSASIANRATDIARLLTVDSIRVIDAVSGTVYAGIEVPNRNRKMITLYDVTISPQYQETKAALPLCLGTDVVGVPVVMDLTKAPHLIIAGTTGSGKSAGLNTMLLSMLIKRSPEELRLILIDPKRLEFSLYADLPHLITPVVTDVADKTIAALTWSIEEMERRYKLLETLKVRKLEEYNALIDRAKENGEVIYDPAIPESVGSKRPALKKLPYLVIVIEEFADLMAQTSNRKRGADGPDDLVGRIAAKGRAAGIHIILATQTPRSDVITGTVNTNFPSRVAFTVRNGIDSKVILDETGAESLLGNGDMICKFTGQITGFRAHGAYSSNQDVESIVNAWIEHGGVAEYIDGVVDLPEEAEENSEDSATEKLDKYFDKAADFARTYYAENQKYPPISDYQIHLGVGYPRAKKLAAQLRKHGVVS